MSLLFCFSRSSESLQPFENFAFSNRINKIIILKKKKKKIIETRENEEAELRKRERETFLSMRNWNSM